MSDNENLIPFLLDEAAWGQLGCGLPGLSGHDHGVASLSQGLMTLSLRDLKVTSLLPANVGEICLVMTLSQALDAP